MWSKPSPDVPDAFVHVRRRTVPTDRRRIAADDPAAASPTLNTTLRLSTTLDVVQQSAVLRIDVVEQPVVDRQRRTRHAGIDREKASTAYAPSVCVSIECAVADSAHRSPPDDTASRCSAYAAIVGMPRAHLAPRDVAVAVGVETDRVVEVAQRDVPLAAQRTRRRARSSDRRRSACAPNAGRRDAARRRAAERSRIISRTIATAATATSSSPRRRDPLRGDFQRSGVAGRTRRFDEDAQVGRFALDVPVRARKRERAPGVAFRSSRRKRASSRRCRLSPRRRAASKRAASSARCATNASRVPQATRCSASARRSSSASLLGVVRQQRQHLARAAAVEQEICVRALQVGVARIERQRVAEVPLRGAEVAAALGDLRRQRQRPLAQTGSCRAACESSSIRLV